MDLVDHPDAKEYETLMSYYQTKKPKTPSVTSTIIQVNHQNYILMYL